MSESATKTKVFTEADIEAKLVKLRSAEPDKKVDLIQFFGLELEDAAELPESTIDPFTLLLPPLVRSPHPLLLSSTLTSFLPFYIPLLPLAPLSHLRLAVLQLLPALLEKLNDPKDRVHSSAANAIFLLGERCFAAEPTLSASASAGAKGKEKETLPQKWERCLRDTMLGKATRAKVESMKILVRIRAELGPKVGLKAWLTPLVDLLEDGDGHVRDQAKETVVALLSPASTPPAARSELKKLLLARNVRKTIAGDIITRVLGGGEGSGRSTPAFPSGTETPKDDAVPASGVRSGAATPALGGGDDVEIVYIASPYDLSNEFAAMLPHFEGKETEQNWAPREKSVVRIRGMLKGGVWGKYSEAFVAGLKGGMIEGVSKTIVSLRTTVAQQSCYLLKELVEHLGPAFDQFVEHLLPILGKMAGFTKKIIADRSQACLTAIIIHTTVHPRLLIGHTAAGVADKNIQTRHFCTGHLKTYLDMHGARSKHVIDGTPGLLEQLEGAVKKGLSDVNPAVRDLARQAFWSYNAVWPQRGAVIINALDGMARKQLEKANPRETNGVALTAPTSAAASSTKPAPPAKRATSTMSALLAEKRRAKAAEIGAAKMAQESPRIVSGPVPSSPSVTQGLTRSNSSASISGKTNSGPGQLARSITSPESSPRSSPDPNSPGVASPTPSNRTTPKPLKTLGSPRDLLAHNRDRSSSLGRSSSSRGSPSRDSPLRQSSTFPFAGSPVRSPGTGTGTGSTTPQSARRPLPAFEQHEGLGLTDHPSPEAGSPEAGEAAKDTADAEMGSSPSPRTPSRGGAGVGQEARMAQVAQAESAALQLMEYAAHEGEGEGDEDEDDHTELATTKNDIPFTPARQLDRNGYTHGSAYKTPLNVRSRAWEDSPRPEAVTPLMMQRLKERHHERSWWVKRQELMDKASPLKPSAPAPSSAIMSDLEALESGRAELRNLQKLALFSESHPVLSHEEDGDDGAKGAWGEGRVFDRTLSGLFRFLGPSQPKELLEQGLVVLWEMVQHQWPLFDGHEQELVEALFDLRASHDPTILESTNALISLLTQIADPMYLLTLLRASLDRYLAEHPAAPTPTDDAPTNGFSRLSLSRSESPQDRIRTSGYLFGLTGLGMCVLRLPDAVVEVEGPKLGEVIEAAMSSRSSIVRQSANSLLLAIQTILLDSSKTLSFVPNLGKGQKDLIIYYMAQNGILETSPVTASPLRVGDEDLTAGEGQKDKMLREMEGLMGRGIARDVDVDEEDEEEEGEGEEAV